MSLGGMIRNTVDNSSLSTFVRMCLFRWNLLRYQASNTVFKKNNPGFHIPPDSLLFETGSLHYHSYQNSGQEAAAEIESLCKIFGNSPIQAILDWGCGVGRVTRHLPDYFPGAKITGADVNPSCIQWLQNYIQGIEWIQSSNVPFVETVSGQYDLIIALSVLTHLPANEQANWLNKLHSLLNAQGLVWLSTHGKTYLHQLTHQQKKQLSEQGILTLGADKKGSRQMRTYHTYSGMKLLLGRDWEIVMYYDGQKFPGILGGQDAWLLKKLR
jgi:2-polyprenyl-3-methyl-5-hydroxy-6-metoxy-1,4-benzoquinol methylase